MSFLSSGILYIIRVWIMSQGTLQLKLTEVQILPQSCAYFNPNISLLYAQTYNRKVCFDHNVVFVAFPITLVLKTHFHRGVVSLIAFQFITSYCPLLLVMHYK